MTRGPVLADVRSVTRAFGDTVAVDEVDLELRAGEIHALLGSNGAGKTTLVRMLAGLDRPDSGEISILGQVVDRYEPRALRTRGVALVQQHFTLVPTLSASENLELARPEGRLRARRGRAGARLGRLVERTGLVVRDDVPARELSVGEQQRLELLRALDADARILLLDEPTAVLTDAEADQLLEVCRVLADDGRALVFITHRLGEVVAGCDRVTVLRDGRVVLADAVVDGQDRAALATAMVGSSSSGVFADRSTGREVVTDRPARLRIEGLRHGRLAGIDIAVGAGEIVGVAGVDGNGQDDLEAAVSGRSIPDGGSVVLDGEPVPAGAPRARRAAGLAYVPSDRYRHALVRQMSLSDNTELGQVRRWRRRRRRRHDAAEPLLDEWDVRSAGAGAPAATLSGGNAQKLVLARELAGHPSAVLACYPTRGLDPVAADAVAARLVRCAADDAAVLWMGAELDELLAVADRIVVLAGGAVTGWFTAPFDRERIGLAMAGDLVL